ncbi:glycosyltransferase involved in cell wall biosynthesis [Kribbella amoyensis]|uniref:Glycosyltransferase involved in cell wall biosynthesis n=1 Tax=Kribbella amoyensis TaxID=996641 RepID=A0A561BXZ3_9ACTN|nr:glycosyltransferase family 4 protein [Kribbella amoyensis]TWD83711.1 glycosyltransferase involved in cell wall biosynthesis [Kribbella amoyensis]
MRASSVLILNWRDTTNPEGGGSERYVEEVAKGLAVLGWSVTVLCAAYPGSPREANRDEVRYLYRGSKVTVYLRGLLHTWSRRPDHVIDVQNGLPFFTRLVRRDGVVVLVHHVHQEQWPVVYPGWRGRFGWWLESRVAPRLYRDCRYVTVSSASRDELLDLRVDAARIDVIHNGTDPAPARQLPQASVPTVVCVGRIVPHKQVEHAVDAIGVARRTMPDARLIVVGSGWWEDSLRAYVRECGLEDAVEFRGHVSEDDKHAAYDEAWVLALPSLKEGWGLVVGEAAGHGVPTVAYRSAGGPTESVRDGRTGVLVDDRAEFCATITRLLAEQGERQRLAAGALATAGAFTWAATVRSFDRILTGLPAAEPETAAAEQAAELETAGPADVPADRPVPL